MNVETSLAQERLVSREGFLAEQVLFLDGFSGTGKTMLGPILATLDRVEAIRLEHLYELVCGLRYLDRIASDAATALIRLYVDQACYNMMISREANFRWKDLSCVANHPAGWRYIRRLFLPDGDAVVGRIRRERPILQIHTHYALAIAQPLFDALDRRMVLVEMLRHPLYLIAHGVSYIERYGHDPRDFTIWFAYQGHQLPWFARGWEAEYLDCAPTDRVIYTLDRLTAKMRAVLDAPETADRLVVVPFERLVLDPWPQLEAIASRLGSRTTTHTSAVLRKQRVPRRTTTAGRDLPIYRRYHWGPVEPGRSEREEYERRWDEVRRQASPHALRTLEHLSADYEASYWKPA